MKKCLIISCFFCACLFAQNHRIDSLSALLNTITEDTNQVITYNKLGFELIWLGEFDRALPYITSGLELSKKIGFKRGIAHSYNGLGIIYRNKGEHKKALHNYFSSLEIAIEMKSKHIMGSLYVNIGRVYANLGDYPKAIEWFYKSLKIMQMIGDKSKTANVLRGIGQIFLKQNDHRAKICFTEALKLYEEIKVYDGTAGSLNDLGEYYARMGNQTKAVDYYYRSLKASEKASYETEKASSHNNLGLIYSNQGQYGKALEHFLIALELYKRLNNNNEQSNVYYNLGELELNSNNFQKALGYYQLSLEKSLMSGVLEQQKDAHEGLSKVYEILGKTADALVHYKSFIKVKEQIFNDDNTKKLLRVELNYELEAKEQELKFAQEKIQARIKQGRIQSYFLLVSLAFLILLGLFLFQRLSLKQKLKVSVLRNKIAIDLHDEVGSALSSISMYTGITQMNKGAAFNEEIIEKIGRTSRETIENMSDIVWSIQPKNDQFRNVLDKMKHFGHYIMGGAGIQFRFLYPDSLHQLNLDMEQRKNLYLFYKEGLNNAAKYSNATEVSAELFRKRKMITLTITDNGTGFDVAKVTPGNGLHNMRERAAALNGDFQISSQTGKGTTLTLRFRIS